MLRGQNGRNIEKIGFSERRKLGQKTDFFAFFGIFMALLSLYPIYMTWFSRVISCELKKIIFRLTICPWLHIEANFKMVKFAKIAKMTVIIAFSQGARGAKNRKNLIFSKWFEITQIMFFGCFLDFWWLFQAYRASESSYRGWKMGYNG